MNTMSDAARLAATGAPTHEVKNQSRPPAGYDAFDGDAVLREIVARDAPWAVERCAAVGELAGDERAQELARLANRHAPELRTHDRYGHRIDWVELHPAWHELMALAWRHEVHALAWTAGKPGAHLARAALSYLWNQVEQGTGCPVAMAYSAHAGFGAERCLSVWRDRVAGREYAFDRREVGDKPSVVVGYAMTEKQGGSDLRETQTAASFAQAGDYHGAPADWYALTGHKWFCSVPQADGFFTLARTAEGVTCFFLPRTLPDGSHNRFLLQRLKDKCGNRSNASSEVEFAGTLAIRVGEEGHGIREILTHAHLTRLDFAVASAGLMRQALTLALNHAATRRAFHRPLAEQPMMANVLADLAVEVEAATRMALRAASATDAGQSDPRERRLARVATPLAKYFNCAHAPAVVYESLQCLGGNGFIEESPMPRLYREAPLNSVWEGTSNMMCMDVLRVMRRDPAVREAFFDELAPARTQDRRLDAFAVEVERLVDAALDDEFLARPLADAMTRALQASELVRHAPPEVVDAFFASRVAVGRGATYGTLGAAVGASAAAAIVARAHVIR